jgi:hypothetical protein
MHYVAGASKKPKLVEMKKKDRKKVRKQSGNNQTFEIAEKSKNLWEELRRYV